MTQVHKIILAIIAIIIIWICAFFYYIYYINSYKISTSPSNAIAVIAGGEKRIETASALLKQNYAPVLFITNVNSTNQFTNFFKEYKINTAQVIYNVGGNTTQEWANKISNFINANSIKSIRLVTSSYNMPSILKFVIAKLIYPTVIIPHPVYSQNSNYWVVFKAYNQYLYQMIGLH